MRRWRRRLVVLLALLGILAVVGNATSSSSSSSPASIRQLAFKLPNGRGVAVHVATNELEQRTGVVGRRLTGGRGLLFVHAPGPPPGFTMAGVRQPLAILFVGSAGELLGLDRMRLCARARWQDCPIYRAPTGTRVSIEFRPEVVGGLHPGQLILNRNAIELLVR